MGPDRCGSKADREYGNEDEDAWPRLADADISSASSAGRALPYRARRARVPLAPARPRLPARFAFAFSLSLALSWGSSSSSPSSLPSGFFLAGPRRRGSGSYVHALPRRKQFAHAGFCPSQRNFRATVPKWSRRRVSSLLVREPGTIADATTVRGCALTAAKMTGNQRLLRLRRVCVL